MSQKEIRECIMIASAILYSKANVEEEEQEEGEEENEKQIFKRYRGADGLGRRLKKTKKLSQKND
jgi:hypothetical protein